jgi:hypothetical protein
MAVVSDTGFFGLPNRPTGRRTVGSFRNHPTGLVAYFLWIPLPLFKRGAFCMEGEG